MEKCFITKLSGTVDNDSLPVYGKMTVSCPKTGSIAHNVYLSFAKGTQIEVVGDGYFTDSSGSSTGKTADYTIIGSITTYYLSDAVTALRMDKYSLVSISPQYTNGYSSMTIDLDDLKYDSNIKSVRGGLKGSINNLKGSMVTLQNTEGTSVTGDLATFLNENPNVTIIDLPSCTGITGTIRAVNSGMTQFNVMNNANVSGDVSVFKDCASLVSWNANNGNFSGDISAFANKTGLKSLSLLNNKNITGDISTLASDTAIQGINVSLTGVTGDITNIVANCTDLKSLYIPTGVTITEEQKTTLTGRGCTVGVDIAV